MLQIFVSETIEPLADRLAERLSLPSPHPFDKELVAVPGGGMNRWIRLELARRLGTSEGRTDGVAANIEFVFPGTIRSRVVNESPQPSDEKHAEPWAIERLVWTVLDLISDGSHAAVLGPVASLPVGATWYGRARSIADLFDHYSVHRPAMVRSWHQGLNVDPAGEPLRPSHVWQPILWRLVRRAVGSPSIAERLPNILATLRTDPGAFAHVLPQRLAIFGSSSFPGGQEFIDLTQAIAEHREVDLYLVAPSLDARSTKSAHPLLSTWARPSHDAAELSRRNGFTEEILPSSAPAPTSLLDQLKTDIRSNQAPTHAAQDTSLQLHECFGPIRQLEACRDAVLAALADDDTLAESDITVLIPDIVRFAPLIPSVFGPSATRWTDASTASTPPLRYVVTDRSLEVSTDFADGLVALIRLLPGRFSRSEVLEFLANKAVQTRFTLRDDDSAIIDGWVATSTIRWGLNAAHRTRWGIPASFDANTWRHGVDQLLAGIAVFDDTPALGPGDVAARGVEGNAVAVLGCLAAVIDTLEQLVTSLESPRTVHDWVDWTDEAIGALLSTSSDDEWQHDQVRSVLTDLTDNAAGVSIAPLLSFTEFSQLLSQGLKGQPGRNRFFAGGITITSMQPMRWLSSRVTCIVGLDESVFAAPTSSGDDLVSQHTVLGDIDPRSDRRQAVLETILSTTDRLIITRTANNERTNATVPPAIAVSELEDVLATMTSHTFAASQHARQLFDTKHLSPGSAALATFDRRALESAIARSNRPPNQPWIEGPLDPVELPNVSVRELFAFLAAPPRTFFTARLGTRLFSADERSGEHLITSLDALENWSLTDELLHQTVDIDDWSYYHTRRGDLPAGISAKQSIATMTETASNLSSAASDAFDPGTPLDAINVDITLDDTRVLGVVDQVVSHGEEKGILFVTNSKTNPKLLLDCWLRLIIATLAEPQSDWQSTLIAARIRKRKKDNFDKRVMTIRGATAEARQQTAAVALRTVLDLYKRALCEPLPLFAKTSGLLYSGKKASDAWKPFNSPGEADNVYNAEVWGRQTFESMLDIPAEEHDPPGADDSRVRRYADHLWGTVAASLQGDLDV